MARVDLMFVYTFSPQSFVAPPSRLPPRSSVACQGYCPLFPINETLFGESEGLYVHVSYGVSSSTRPLVPSAGFIGRSAR